MLKRKEDGALQAAAAVRKYRINKRGGGYAPLQMWVPAHLRKDLREMVHEEVERRLAIEMPEGPEGGGDFTDQDDL